MEQVDEQQVDQSLTDSRKDELCLFVPICVNLRQERADDGTCSRWTLESIAWSLVNASSGSLLQSKTLILSSDAITTSEPNPDKDDIAQNTSNQADVATLAEAIKQIDESVEPYGGADKCALVTCGPLHLRQHLHPAAMRSKLCLSGLYDRYIDLAKEFQQIYQGALLSKPSISMNGQLQSSAISSQPQKTTATDEHSLSAGSSSTSCTSNGSRDSYNSIADQNLPPHLYQTDTCYCWYCHFYDYYPAGICGSPMPTSGPVSANVAYQQYNFPEQQFHSSALAHELTQVAPPKHKQQQQQQQQVTATTRLRTISQQSSSSTAKVNSAAVVATTTTASSGQHYYHNQRQLRQLAEMFKFLSIESQPEAAGASADGSLQQVRGAQAGIQEEEVLRCEKCHLAASEVAAGDGVDDGAGEQKLELRLENEQQPTNGQTHGLETNKAASLHDDNAAESCCATALQPTGDRVIQQRQKEQQQSLTTALGTGAGSSSNSTGSGSKKKPLQIHCSACSSLASSKLVHSMSLVIERMLKEGHKFNRFEQIKRVVEVGLSDSNANDSEHKVVRARGLPWQATEQEITNFFIGLNIARGGVSLCLSRQGRRNGEALIQFESREHRNLALGRHKHFMGPRYIEVYRASGEDFASLASGYNNKTEAFLSKGAQVIVRMRGLPFTCTSKQIVEFFNSSTNDKLRCEVLGQEEGVLFVKNQDDKPTGDAFVLFANEEFAQRALQKDHQNIGPRYVELFRSSISEVQQVLSISKDTSGHLLNSQHQQPKLLLTNNQSINQNNRSIQNNGELSLKNRFVKQHVQHQPAGQFTYAQAATPSFAAVAATAEACNAKRHTPCSNQMRNELASQSSEAAGGIQTGGGSSTSSAFDNNSLNSETVTSEELAVTSGSEEGGPAPSTTGASVGTTSDQTAPASQKTTELLLRSASSTAQSPISSLSATSTGSSSYGSSQYSGGQRNNITNYNHNHNNYHHHQQRNYNHNNGRNHQYQSNNFHHQHHQPYTHYQHHIGAHHYATSHLQHQQHHYISAGEQSHLLPGAMAGNHQHQNHNRLAGAVNGYHQNAHSYHPMATYQHHHNPYPAPLPAAAYPTMAPYHHHHHHPHPHSHHQLQMAAMGAARPGEHYYGAEHLHQSQHQALSMPISRGADCVRLHGLPFEAQVEDVLYFFGDHSKNIVFQGVHMVYSAQGQPSGEAIVQMNSVAAASAVSQVYHKKVMQVGKKQRYVEVHTCSVDDLHLMLGVGLMPQNHAAAAALSSTLPAMQPQLAAGHYLNPATSNHGIDPHQHQQHQEPNSMLHAAPNQKTISEGEVKISPPASDETKVIATCDDNDQNDDTQNQQSTTQQSENIIDHKSALIINQQQVEGPQLTTATLQQTHSVQPNENQTATATAAFMPATYYPILYYYPPHHPQMLAAAAAPPPYQ